MASNKRRCPYCFSQIKEEDGSGDQTWFNDPFLIPSGSPTAITHIPINPEETNFIMEQVTNIPIYKRAFKGFSQIKYSDIYELQQERINQEISIGLLEEERTEFSQINDSGKFPITKQHLIELRESTEKILTYLGHTKIEENKTIVDLEQFFNYDEEGTEYNLDNHQLEWIDPELILWKGYITNLHLEDLRHYLPVGWFEDFTNLYTTDEFGNDISFSFFSGLYSVSSKIDENTPWDEDYNEYREINNAIVINNYDIKSNKSNKITLNAELTSIHAGVGAYFPGRGSSQLEVKISDEFIEVYSFSRASLPSSGDFANLRANGGSRLDIAWNEDNYTLFNDGNPNIKLTPNSRGFITYDGLGNSSIATNDAGAGANITWYIDIWHDSHPDLLNEFFTIRYVISHIYSEYLTQPAFGYTTVPFVHEENYTQELNFYKDFKLRYEYFLINNPQLPPFDDVNWYFSKNQKITIASGAGSNALGYFIPGDGGTGIANIWTRIRKFGIRG